jgi:thioesterase-3
VRGYHLDLYGHVNNARYLEFLEEARWNLIEEHIDLGRWKEKGIALTVVNININYRRQASLGDLLEIRSGVSELGGKSGTIRQEIRLTGSNTIIADADVTFVVVDSHTGKALPMDHKMFSALRAMLE